MNFEEWFFEEIYCYGGETRRDTLNLILNENNNSVHEQIFRLLTDAWSNGKNSYSYLEV
jgi:hypothetical protein